MLGCAKPSRITDRAANTNSAAAAAAASMSAAVHNKWRLELFFKSQAELMGQISLLRKHNINCVNITNKSDEDNLLATAQLLQQAIPAIDLCIHYSIKYNYDKNPNAVLSKLQAFCSQLQQQTQQQLPRASPAAERGAACEAAPASCHVLLVSGGGKKKRVETVSALQHIAACKAGAQQQPPVQLAAGASKKRPRAAAGSADSECSSIQSWPSIAVAYNPYLPDEQDAAVERHRLRAKLQTGLVDKVYLQMGTDLDKLAAGLEYANALFEQLYIQAGKPPPQVYGSVFLPSKRLLAQMRFRPWNGVVLSPEYLSCVEAADAYTRKLLKVYATAGVVPLVESAVKNDSDFTYLLGLLSDCLQ